MSRGGAISLMPGALERGARDATRVSDEFEHALSSLSGIDLSGLPPASRGRTAGAISHARSAVHDAGLEARGHGDELRLRAALARAADEGGTINPLDIAAKLWGKSRWPREALGLGKGLAKELADREAKILLIRLAGPMGGDVAAELARLGVQGGSITQTAARLKQLRELERKLTKLTPWSKKLIDLKKLSPSGSLKLLRGAGNAVPTFGDVAGVVVNVKKGMSKSEALLRGAKDIAITVAAPAAGAAACGFVTVGSGGTLAAACVPIMTAAIGISAKVGSDKLINAEKKALDKHYDKRQRERERAEALRRHPTGRCEVNAAPQARPLR